MKKSLPLAALLGAAPISALMGAGSMIALSSEADATPVSATLIGAGQNSSRYGFYFWSTSLWNTSESTATWTLDVETGVATQTGGDFYLGQVSPATHYMAMTSATLGNFTATASTWACLEGTFGRAVGASICGAYNFGSNKVNQSTYTPTATSGIVTLGGDDSTVGQPLSLENTLSFMSLTAVGGAPSGYQWYCLSNAAPAPNTDNNCSTDYYPTGPYRYSMLFQTAAVPIPPAVWLFGSALGLMGVVRRKVSSYFLHTNLPVPTHSHRTPPWASSRSQSQC